MTTDQTNSLTGAFNNAVQNVGNAVVANKANKKARDFAREQYQTSKNDNIAFWQQNNEYNSPQQQMKRLQDAGLNPNLVYGNGAVANSASAPNAPSPTSANTHTYQNNGETAMDTYFNMQAKQAQIDVMKTQNTVSMFEGIIKSLTGTDLQNQISANLKLGESNGGLTAYDFNAKRTKYDSLGEKAETELKQIKSGIAQATSVEAVEAEIQRFAGVKLNNEVNTERKNQIQSGISLMKTEQTIKEYDLKMQKNGVARDSPWYLKGLYSILENYNIINFKN